MDREELKELKDFMGEKYGLLDDFYNHSEAEQGDILKAAKRTASEKFEERVKDRGSCNALIDEAAVMVRYANYFADQKFPDRLKKFFKQHPEIKQHSQINNARTSLLTKFSKKHSQINNGRTL